MNKKGKSSIQTDIFREHTKMSHNFHLYALISADIRRKHWMTTPSHAFWKDASFRPTYVHFRTSDEAGNSIASDPMSWCFAKSRARIVGLYAPHPIRLLSRRRGLHESWNIPCITVLIACRASFLNETSQIGKNVKIKQGTSQRLTLKNHVHMVHDTLRLSGTFQDLHHWNLT